MKHNLYFFIIISIIANSCTAMQTLQITKELPAIKHKRYVSFLTDQEFIIQGKESWDIIDSKTHKTIKILDDAPYPAKLDIHPNQKTFMIFGKDKLNVYDTKTKQGISQYLSKQEIKFAQFDPLNNNIAYIIATSDAFPNAYYVGYNMVIKHDYHSTTNLVLYAVTGYNKLCTHPTNTSLCYLMNENILHQPHDKNIVSLPFAPYDNKNIVSLPFAPYDIFYNPNGSIIIARHRNKIITIDLSKFTIDKCLHSDTFNESFESAKMYSNNLLALLVVTESDGKEFLRVKFYNIADLLPYSESHQDSVFDAQPQPVAQTKKIEIEMIWERKPHTFSFSPDGKQCMVGFHHKALLFDIPFEIMHEPETKKRLSHLLFVLKNYEIQLPSDLIKLLAHISLETYKRYHLTHSH